MIFSGDEFGNSQGGNNNPYCQDNETGWVDWKALERNRELFDYVKFLLKLRFSYKFLHHKAPYKLMDYISCGYPDLSCHGKEAWRPDLSGYSHVLGMLYCGLYEKGSKDKPFFYVCYNMHWNKTEFALPKLPDGLKWSLISDTGRTADSGELTLEDNSKDLITERSVRIYTSVIDPDYKKKKEVKRKKNGKH